MKRLVIRCTVSLVLGLGLILLLWGLLDSPPVAHADPGTPVPG